MERTGIVFIVESGWLEEQCKVLVYSLRKWANLPEGTVLMAYKPRKGGSISNETKAFLRTHKVELIDLPLNNSLDFYPLANKPLVASHFASHNSQQFTNLLFLDTDLLACLPLNDLQLAPGRSLAARTWIQHHLHDAAYQDLRKSLFQDYFPTVREREMLLPDGHRFQTHYNTAVILLDASHDFFHHWKENMLRIFTDRRIRRMKGLNFYFLEESVFSYTALDLIGLEGIQAIDMRYNAPIEPRLQSLAGIVSQQIHLLHYHHLSDLWKLAEESAAIQQLIDGIKPQVDLSKKAPRWRKWHQIMRFQYHKILKSSTIPPTATS